MSPASSADAMRACFDSVEPLTVGLEEEAMLLDPGTLDLTPLADPVLARFDGDPRVKGELPASQVELITEPTTSVAAAIAQLTAARRDLAEGVRDMAIPAVAGVHPFAHPLGGLRGEPRYVKLQQRYGPIAKLQLVCALQVHVAIGGAERTIAVHNALRSHLPEIAALTANSPFFAGRDSGLASVRPLLAGLLTRQGIPPAIDSLEAFAEELRWGAAAGAMAASGQWWWELRPHASLGTLEVRVPDAQTTVGHAAAVAAVVQCLAALLVRRVEEGAASAPAPSWRIEENRWSAARSGLDGEMADLASGERQPTRARVERLLAELAPFAAELGCAAELASAHELLQANGATRMRAAAGPQADPHAATRWLADAYLPPRSDAA